MFFQVLLSLLCESVCQLYVVFVCMSSVAVCMSVVFLLNICSLLYVCLLSAACLHSVDVRYSISSLLFLVCLYVLCEPALLAHCLLSVCLPNVCCLSIYYPLSVCPDYDNVLKYINFNVQEITHLTYIRFIQSYSIVRPCIITTSAIYKLFQKKHAVDHCTNILKLH